MNRVYLYLATMIFIATAFVVESACGQETQSAEDYGHVRPQARDVFEPVPRSYFETPRQGFLYRTALHRFTSSDPDLMKSQGAISKALAFYFRAREGNETQQCGGDPRAPAGIANQKWVVVVDYTRPNLEYRKFHLNMETGEVVKDFASHGSGSGDGTEIPTVFGDGLDSGMTNGGFFLSQDVYTSRDKHGRPRETFGGEENNALRLIGLEERNKMSLTGQDDARGIVDHGATYVYEGNVGNSLGCPAGQLDVFNEMKYELDNGALYYLHTIEDEEGGRPS
ncbi:MAG: murein L,D-transpeptidase catalytic domain-containing protein, partial [Pseudomonadota bacterium]